MIAADDPFNPVPDPELPVALKPAAWPPDWPPVLSLLATLPSPVLSLPAMLPGPVLPWEPVLEEYDPGPEAGAPPLPPPAKTPCEEPDTTPVPLPEPIATV